MNYFKNIGISFLYTFLTIIIFTFIVTILSYFNIISHGLLSFFEILISSVSFFIGGYIIGKKSKKKGWLEGIKLFLFIMLLVIVINLILHNNLQFKNILYYLILLSLMIIGSMIGINKK